MANETVELYYKGKPVNPNRDLPTRTYAEAQAEGLTSSDKLWVRNDGSSTPINAEQIVYGNSNVKSALDDMIEETSFSPTTNANGVASSSYYNILTNKVILSAICTSEEDSIVTLGHNTAGNWLKVMNYDLTPIANTQVTIKMWYKDLSYNP